MRLQPVDLPFDHVKNVKETFAGTDLWIEGPYAEGVRCSNGVAFSQWIHRYSYNIRFYSFQLLRTTSFYWEEDVGMAAVFYLVQGRFFYACRGSDFTSQHRSARLAYLPAGRQVITLPEGTHRFFQVCFTREHVSAYKGLEPILNELVEAMHTQATAIEVYKPVDLGPATEKLLHTLFAKKHASELERIMYEKMQVDQCLLDYIAAVHQDVDDPMVKVRYFILQNPLENDSVTEIARRFNISDSKLKRGFKRNYGMAVHDFRLRQRVQLAKEMIVKEKVALQEVVDRCGFYDYSHLFRMFKRHTGQTPKEFRDQLGDASLEASVNKN